MKEHLTFKIEKDGDEFHAWCEELNGCHTHGKSQKEALENLRDAVHLYLDVTFDQLLQNAEMELSH